MFEFAHGRIHDDFFLLAINLLSLKKFISDSMFAGSVAADISRDLVDTTQVRVQLNISKKNRFASFH